MTAVNHRPPVPVTFLASEDLTAYRFVKLGSSGEEVDACDTQGEAAVGIAIHDVDQSEADGVSVWLLGDGGIQLVEASAAITVMDEITTGTDGRAEAAATGDVILGRVVEAASGAGALVPFIPEYSGRVHG